MQKFHVYGRFLTATWKLYEKQSPSVDAC